MVCLTLQPHAAEKEIKTMLKVEHYAHDVRHLIGCYFEIDFLALIKRTNSRGSQTIVCA